MPIYTLNDTGSQGNNNRGRAADYEAGRGQAGGGGRRLLFGTGQEGEKPPRKENYFDMWKTTFCPSFTVCSFTFLLIVLQIFLFILTLIHSAFLENGLNDMFFLGV